MNIVARSIAIATRTAFRSLQGTCRFGSALSLEFVPNEDRISPPRPATFAFMMLASTPKDDAYTEREYAAMGEAAGLGRMRLAPTPPSPQSMLIFDRD